ncbi:MAG: hypothetical protein Unbinned1469contig1000_6 [Prokaryotic dsDNA virus sp.]|jgi:hypothetical protein|nr:MAG: hypothetical protein Unbinned1469contig1000_6 [Prokaryotic dsDNA virus sp.]|tara:strand:- start:969 stop:1598 length:630 start_codon:yes stop_codon:yes gene_type:complete
MAHSQYIDKNDLKTYIGLSGTSQDTNIDNAINAACRLIDQYTGRRFFQDETTQIKYFRPVNEFYLVIPDLSTTTGLVVQLDTTDDGTYDKTLTLDTDFQMIPVNPEINKVVSDVYYYKPYNELRILPTRSSERFDPLIANNVKITGKWGWTKVPEAVTQAALIQALRFFKRKDAPFNVLGNEQTGQIEIFTKFDPDAKQLIEDLVIHRL